MKLILAGDTGLYGPNDYKYFIYNCNRNKCQEKYTVPIPDLSKLQFFVFFGSKKPSTMDFDIVSSCGTGCSYYTITNNNPDAARYGYITCTNHMVDSLFEAGQSLTVYAKIGSVLPASGFTIVDNGISAATIAQDYIVGKLPNGQWYGVFKNFTVPTEFDPTCFVVTVAFTFEDDSEVRYFSQEICINDCGELMEIKACFPEKATKIGFDLNKIYYGFHNGDAADILGDLAVRYFHKYYVRLGYIVNTAKKTTFKTYLSRNFRTEIQYLHELRCELVPEFYSDYLMAAASRGEITVRETMSMAAKKWTLSETNFELVDDDAKLWKPVIILEEIFKEYFGCDECLNGEQACLGNPISYLRTNIDPEQYTFTFLGGTVGAGESIQYEVRNKITGVLIASGNVNALPGSFSVPVADMDLDANCFTVRWRKACATDLGSFSLDYSDDFEVGGAAGAFSEWTQKTEGNCVTTPAYYACKNYTFGVFGPDDSEWSITATLCDGTPFDSGTHLVSDGAQAPICAREGSVNVTGNTNITSETENCGEAPTARLVFSFVNAGGFLHFEAALNIGVDADISITKVFADGFTEGTCTSGAVASAQKNSLMEIPAGIGGVGADPEITSGVWATATHYSIYNVIVNGAPHINGDVIVVGSFNVTIVIPGCN